MFLGCLFFSQVYLDISFASDPKVVFPLIIFPPNLAPGSQPGGAMGPYPASYDRGASNSDFAPPSMAMNPYQAGACGSQRTSNIHPPSPYSARSYSAPPPQYPAQPAYMGWGRSNPQVSQLASPYGDPFSSPSSVLHPPPSAPTFYPPPSATEVTPSVTSPPTNVSPAVPPPTYASAPLMDFLCQSDEPPPSYSVLFPSSEQSNAK